MQLNSYTEKLKAFSDNVSQAKNIATELKMTNAADNLKKVLSNLKTDSFHLVVVGEFSRGKSTFVNALLGRKILPASKNPTTAIISKIIYGKTPKFSIFYKNRSKPQTLSEEDFKKITAPKEPDESDIESVTAYQTKQQQINDIDHAEISYPLPFCRDNVEVIDTPGTNDLNVGRMEITYGYLNQADACILLLSATQPLSKSEAEFLQERVLGNKIQDIFFVVSHKGQLQGDAKEEKRVLNFVKEHLQKILPKNFKLDDRIFLIESRGALFYYQKQRGEELKPKQELELPKSLEDTGFPSFENALGYFLANDKGNVKISRYVDKVENIFATIQHDLSVNMEIISHSTDEIRQKAANMEPKFKNAKRRAEKIIRDMQFNFESAGSDIDYKCKSAAHSILMKAKAAVNSLDKDMSNNEMKNIIERAVTSEKKNFIESTMSDWTNIFDGENAKTSSALKKIWNDIDLEYRHEFNLPAIANSENLSIDIEVDRSQSFSQRMYSAAASSFGKVFDKGASFLSRVGNLLEAAGGFMFGVFADAYNRINGTADTKQNWRDKVRASIEKTYGSLDKELTKELTRQYKKNADDICNNFQDKVDARIDDMQKQLQNILREKKSQEQDAARKKNYLLQKQNELRIIEQNLISLKK